MSDDHKDPSLELGVFGRKPTTTAIGTAETIALGLTILWLAATGMFFLVLGGAGTGTGAPSGAMIFIAIFLPVIVIWMAAIAARSARIMREESDRMEAALAAFRTSFVEAQRQQGMTQRGAVGVVEQKLEEIARAARHTEDAMATFASSRGARRLPAAPPPLPAPSMDDEGQAQMALGTPAETLAEPVAVDDLIRAVNFPESNEDVEGFEALRRALSDRKIAQLIQAAQDVLTLLSQDGIYMDDLRPDRARPEIWRRFAQGERGRAVAALGGVRDRSSLALSAGRMRHDAVFRDAVHHFLRRFDEAIAGVEPNLSDEDLARFAETRTARAFMLLGRVTGTFD